MFGVDFNELMVIGVVALIVVGPEKLPRVARTAGHLLGRLQRHVAEVKADINREIQLEEMKRLQSEMLESARELEQSFQAQARELEQSIKPVADEVQSAASELKTAVEASAAEVHNVVGASQVEPVAQTEVLATAQIPPVIPAAGEAAEAPSDEPVDNDAQLDLFAPSEPIRKN
ncbi:MAG: Sec-independent protein translocase protein TatB [Betaproteobacteria bacterium]|nr:Sec-independent protein translocase protein TatB [Betaproteobacteria bacterium]